MNLSNNKISNIDVIQYLYKVHNINFSNNNISNIESIANYPSIKYKNVITIDSVNINVHPVYYGGTINFSENYIDSNSENNKKVLELDSIANNVLRLNIDNQKISSIQTGLIEKDGDLYYYDENGEMVKGKFIEINGKLYYFGASSGAMQKTGWYRNKYYLDPETGEVAVGLKTIDGIVYYFNEQGEKQKGLVEVDGAKYYFDKYGKIVKGQFINIDGKLYYFGASSGVLQKTGWYKKNKKTYYLDKETGEVAIGIKVIDNNTYYFDENGIMQIGLVETELAKYYFDKNGIMVKGQFINIDGKYIILEHQVEHFKRLVGIRKIRKHTI